MAAPEQPRPLLTVEAVAEILGCRPRTVVKLRATGQLTAIKVGELLRFEPSEVERYIASRRQTTPFAR
jgi:excisionase family DNA binding protein